MNIIVSILSILSSITLIISILIIVMKVNQYYTKKNEMEYKSHILNIGLKHYVDQTINEYIVDALEEEITLNPNFINKITITPDDEQYLLKTITTKVITFMSEAFKEQIKMVYNTDITLSGGGNGLTEIITKRSYVKILELSVKSNTPRDTKIDIQKILHGQES